MIFKNPVIKGFYPDPSVCSANGRFYLVSSSFQYFPGVPVFESADLVNWKQIGHVLTKHSQVELDRVRSSGGVFAPTLREHNGRFYMVTNNNSTNKNFYVYTDDIYGEWSEAIEVDQGGIDPSLFFEDDRCYFISNGIDDEGGGGIIQCEIDIATGRKLSESKCIWTGSGGRYIESPHMYKIGRYYYLMVAEGGTEYGHMVTCARSESIWGPFEGYARNPVLTNRNRAPYIIQGIGHGDLIQKEDGSWYIVTLGFRQIGEWEPFHTLGREVFLTPVFFDDEGWFTCGEGATSGTTDEEYEIPGDFTQDEKKEYTFENTDWNIDWCYLRKNKPEKYQMTADPGGAKVLLLKGTDVTLDDQDSPTFIALRQKDFSFEMYCDVSFIASGKEASGSGGISHESTDIENAYSGAEESGMADHKMAGTAGVRDEAGITLYMCEDEHYDIALRQELDGLHLVLKLNIGGIKHIEEDIAVTDAEGWEAAEGARLIIRADNHRYGFYAAPLIIGETDSHISSLRDTGSGVADYPDISNNIEASNEKRTGVAESCDTDLSIDEPCLASEIYLGEARTKYLSSEVSSGFTGTMIGLFATGNIEALFKNFNCIYE